MGFAILSKTIWRVFQVNTQAILFRLDKLAQSQRLFILYNNINFYKKVCDQRLHNKAHIVNYTAEYVCFINAADGSPLPYINRDQVEPKAFNSLAASNFILDQVDINHRAATTWYILSCA